VKDEYLHTMVRVGDLGGRTPVLLRRPGPSGTATNNRLRERAFYGWCFGARRAMNRAGELNLQLDPEAYTGGRNFGHLAYEVTISTRFASACRITA